MISQREVERKYNKMLKDHSKPVTPNHFNNYECRCGTIVKTVDIHRGTTPFIIACPKCGGNSKSTFYNDNLPERFPNFGWARPTLKETIKLRKKPHMLEHVLMGGLVIKEIERTRERNPITPYFWNINYNNFAEKLLITEK